MLSEAAQAIANRDYHGLRCYTGTAPIMRQSGKKTVGLMRYSCNERLRNALYHWSRVSIIRDPRNRTNYAQLRAKGHSHGRALRGIASRWLRVLIAYPSDGPGPLIGGRISTGLLQPQPDKRWGVLYLIGNLAEQSSPAKVRFGAQKPALPCSLQPVPQLACWRFVLGG